MLRLGHAHTTYTRRISRLSQNHAVFIHSLKVVLKKQDYTGWYRANQIHFLALNQRKLIVNSVYKTANDQCFHFKIGQVIKFRQRFSCYKKKRKKERGKKKEYSHRTKYNLLLRCNLGRGRVAPPQVLVAIVSRHQGNMAALLKVFRQEVSRLEALVTHHAPVLSQL